MQREFLEALKNISDTCTASDCSTCQFSELTRTCIFEAGTPSSWGHIIHNAIEKEEGSVKKAALLLKEYCKSSAGHYECDCCQFYDESEGACNLTHGVPSGWKI